MKLFVLEAINGAIDCVGYVANDVTSLCEIAGLINTEPGRFETPIDERYEEYNKEQSEKYSWPYEPFIIKYKLIFECEVSGLWRGDMVFRVEE